MKSINLTKEQKEKLLKMCNALFPEYKETSINSGWLYLNRGEIPLDAIPIFEFCMTHLIEKLYENPLKNFHQQNKGAGILFSIKHLNPVDYLYTEFLKLKK